MENAVICQELFFVREKSHAYVQYACNICAKFQINFFKTLGGVDYTMFYFLVATDGQTDGQGQNIKPPDYRHMGKKFELGC